MRILACSDPVELNTSYSLQMRILMEEIKAEWHYVENGRMIGPTKEYEQNGTVKVYPSREGDISASPTEVRRLSVELNPDLLFLYEDPQHLTKYTTRVPPLPYSGILWFPWDSEVWSTTLTSLMRTSEEVGYKPVCISKHTQKMIQDRGYEIDQVYNIADDTVFRPLSAELVYNEKRRFLQALGKDPDSKILLFVGRFTPRKNMEALFAMVQYLKELRNDFVLVVHGDINDPGRSCDLRMETITRDVVPRVGFNIIKWDVGMAPSELNVLYNMADIYVSASGGEGFGLPIAEAGLCEKPFVVPDNTTGEEFSRNGKHGLLAANSDFWRESYGISRQIVDPSAMANSVDYLLDNPELRAQMGVMFRHWVKENCSRQAICTKFKEMMKGFIPKEVELKLDG
jgi:glycosyltransferase involved in cell wall biosynthesis